MNQSTLRQPSGTKGHSGWPFWRTWALLLVAAAILMGSLSVFTFGLICFVGLFLLWLQEFGKQRKDLLYLVNGTMLFLCIIWFVVNVLAEIIPGAMAEGLLFPLAFLFPPLLAHMYFLETSRQTELGRLWGVGVALFYLGGTFGCVFSLWAYLTLGVPNPFLVWLMGFLTTLFIGSGVFSAGLLSGLSGGEGKKARFIERARKQQRRVNLALLLAMVLMFSVSILAGWGYLGGLMVFIGTISRALPLLFLFVNAYYENRFEFFDVFVKKATIFYIALALLVTFFSLVAPWLDGLNLPKYLRPWVFGLVLAPFTMVLPWLFRRLETWLDRAWLGRTFSTATAVNFFLQGIHEAITSDELQAQAEARLATIFRAETRVSFERGVEPGEPEFTVRQVIPIPSRGPEVGWLFLGPRENEIPYFAGDISLLNALSDVLAFLYQNVSLQAARRQQDRREQELVLDASRSELKALRAQVNPHFLFNALNAVASLTQTDPDRAEETVEQLAEVFRYTLSRSEQEWVRIGDEIEFLRAYLEVEKARFGDRLSVTIEVGEGLESVQIPTMMVQTLVENSIKHAVNRIKGQAWIGVSVSRSADAIEVQVRDNGPGLGDPPNRRQGASPRGSRYGLKNIRERLSGLYAGRASFEIGRDETKGWTVARIRLPLIERGEAQPGVAG